MRTQAAAWALLSLLTLSTAPELPTMQERDPLPTVYASPIPPSHIAEAVSRAMADFPGEYSVALEDLLTGQRWLHNADRLYHPASTVKVPVALYALEQYRAGKIGWGDLIEYTEADVEPPLTGAFEAAEFGDLYPVQDLVHWALAYSDNVAVNMLGRRLGWGNIERWTETIGGRLTHEDRLPRASALSVLQWWRHLHVLSLEDPERASLIVRPLLAATYRGRITAGLPDGVPHMHKHGSYEGSYHDSAIVYATRPYILVVLTEGAPLEEADAAIARLSAEIYRVMTASHSTPLVPVWSADALQTFVGPRKE
ncbi:serine hydrolase [Symbiobacterium thermophilum]|nr:serine hydrolase [Symbiobacterium thermophilum]